MSAIKKKEEELVSCPKTGRTFHHSEYPKQCSCCQKLFLSRDIFWAETEPLKKGDYSEGTSQKVFEYRNCNDCHSTLVTKMNDDRDNSTEGEQRRTEWKQRFQFLVSNGVSKDRAKEILKK